MNKPLILFFFWGSLLGCQSQAELSHLFSEQRPVSRVRPLQVWAAKDLDLAAYTLDAKRGSLAPSSQRFIIKEGDPFKAFASGEYVPRPKHYWVQTELAPPEFIIVERDDLTVGEFDQHEIEPLYVTETRGSCPMFFPRPHRLASLGSVPARTRLFLFHEPGRIGADETPATGLATWQDAEDPAPYFGYYSEAYTNVGYVAKNGNQMLGFASSACLSHPTPLFVASPIFVDQLGSPSAFTASLVAQLGLAEASNVASSNREKKRIARETCANILEGIKPIVDALPHGYPGQDVPTAAVFLCAEKNASGTVTYQMAPVTIGVELTLAIRQRLELLVINLSPPDDASNAERPLDFGAYSYNDVHRTAQITAEPAFENHGTFGEIATGVYRVNAGIRNALWITIESHEQSHFNRFQFSSGAFNQSVLSEYYTEAPWWDMPTSITGQIVHE